MKEYLENDTFLPSEDMILHFLNNNNNENNNSPCNKIDL